jgi:hypothetical protein
VPVENAPTLGLQGDLVAVLTFCQVTQVRVLEDLNNHEADKNGAENTPEQSQHET